MRDERGDSVQVIVTDLALEALGAAEVSPHAVRAHLADIDRLASIKHTAGHLEKDGSIKVTSADVREAGL